MARFRPPGGRIGIEQDPAEEACQAQDGRPLSAMGLRAQESADDEEDRAEDAEGQKSQRGKE